MKLHFVNSWCLNVTKSSEGQKCATKTSIKVTSYGQTSDEGEASVTNTFMTCNSCMCTSVSTHIHIHMQTQKQRNNQKPNPIPKILSWAFCSVMVRPFVHVDQIQQTNMITFLFLVSLNIAFKYYLSAFTVPRVQVTPSKKSQGALPVIVPLDSSSIESQM